MSVNKYATIKKEQFFFPLVCMSKWKLLAAKKKRTKKNSSQMSKTFSL